MLNYHHLGNKKQFQLFCDREAECPYCQELKSRLGEGAARYVKGIGRPK